MKNKQTARITIIFALFVFAHSCAPKPNTLPKNEYGLSEISNIKTYQSVIVLDSNQIMVNITEHIKDIVLDLRYASVNNFMHREMYPANTSFTFLRLPAEKALQQVQQTLQKKGLGLKIFDAYRPFDVTKKFWDLVHDERYVANPAKGSGHNRGIAVDLTIIDSKTKQELDMGTGFDDFTDSAHPSFTSFPEKVIANRKLLKETMQQYGFKLFETEWWHYSWPDPEKFEIMNLSFQDLKKIAQ